MRYWAALLLAMSVSGQVHAAVQTEFIQYKDGDTVLQGYLAYDGANQNPRPGVLVVHEWMGFGSYTMRRAEQLAQLGYVAFAADMYGKGVTAKDHKEAGMLSGVYRNDRQLMRRRISAALETLKQYRLTDPKRIAAIGYCFGGTSVLELARSGADVAGVVSFHGALDTPHPEDAHNIKGKVLVLHGADDTFVKPDQVAAFEDEMRKAHVDYRLIKYPGAVHSFTVAEAGTDPSKGMAYNEDADKQSWEAMKTFLAEIFKEPSAKGIGTTPEAVEPKPEQVQRKPAAESRSVTSQRSIGVTAVPTPAVPGPQESPASSERNTEYQEPEPLSEPESSLSPQEPAVVTPAQPIPASPSRQKHPPSSYY